MMKDGEKCTLGPSVIYFLPDSSIKALPDSSIKALPRPDAFIPVMPELGDSEENIPTVMLPSPHPIYPIILVMPELSDSEDVISITREEYSVPLVDHFNLTSPPNSSKGDFSPESIGSIGDKPKAKRKGRPRKQTSSF